jgi:hypothetical protein
MSSMGQSAATPFDDGSHPLRARRRLQAPAKETPMHRERGSWPGKRLRYCGPGASPIPAHVFEAPPCIKKRANSPACNEPIRCMRCCAAPGNNTRSPRRRRRPAPPAQSVFALTAHCVANGRRTCVGCDERRPSSCTCTSCTYRKRVAAARTTECYRSLYPAIWGDSLPETGPRPRGAPCWRGNRGPRGPCLASRCSRPFDDDSRAIKSC